MYFPYNLVDSYTYLIMALSAAGGLFAKNYGKKYGFPLLPFLIAFLAAPSAGFYAKKEADFFYMSHFSKYYFTYEGRIRPLSFSITQF